MRILHVAAHLGGGVGKAHSSLVAADPSFVERHYVLMEAPRDPRYAASIAACGAAITIAPTPEELARLAAEADIVQIEWWNHPRIYQCLCETAWPVMRTVVWCHISGLAAPFVPAGLMTAGDRFLFTSSCSLASPTVATLKPDARRGLGVVNSGFGFLPRQKRSSRRRRPGSVGYLGTVDFSKMSREFFDVVDATVVDGEPVSVWGAVDPASEVMQAARAMRRPDSIRFRGHAEDPAAALADIQILLYLLHRDHFGTAENALVEAMSCGCTPIVFANPAEAAIVRDGETGFVVDDAGEAADRLAFLLAHPQAAVAMGRNAAEDVAATRMATYSAAAFARIYGALIARDKRPVDFHTALGTSAADWYLGTRSVDGSMMSSGEIERGAAAKGTIDHFFSCYPQDESLQRLVGGGRAG